MAVLNSKTASAFIVGLVSWLLLFSSFAHPGAAAPIEDYNNTLAERLPPFPTLAECRKAIRPGQPPINEAAYFTRTTSQAQIEKLKIYAEDHGLVHVTESGVWTRADFTNLRNYKGTVDERSQFLRDFSQVYAEKTQGRAYLLMKYTDIPARDSIFFSVEFPTIKAAGNVNEIIWLDAEHPPDDPTTITKTWWRQGQPDPPSAP